MTEKQNFSIRTSRRKSDPDFSFFPRYRKLEKNIEAVSDCNDKTNIKDQHATIYSHPEVLFFAIRKSPIHEEIPGGKPHGSTVTLQTKPKRVPLGNSTHMSYVKTCAALNASSDDIARSLGPLMFRGSSLHTAAKVGAYEGSSHWHQHLESIF